MVKVSYCGDMKSLTCLTMLITISTTRAGNMCTTFPKSEHQFCCSQTGLCTCVARVCWINWIEANTVHLCHLAVCRWTDLLPSNNCLKVNLKKIPQFSSVITICPTLKMVLVGKLQLTKHTSCLLVRILISLQFCLTTCPINISGTLNWLDS